MSRAPGRPGRNDAPTGASAATVVTGRIGRGGMGMVYRGLDEALEREVALKTLTIEGTLDEESRRRFEIEAKAAAKLQHPNIVTVFELGEDRGRALHRHGAAARGRPREPRALRESRCSSQEKLDIVIQVCRGLAYAHEHGIVHRDIKPSNIRLLDDGTVEDHGLRDRQARRDAASRRRGMMVGTVHYMSPEQVRGKPLDGRSDVFSAGRDPLRAARRAAALPGRGRDRGPLQDRQRRAPAPRSRRRWAG